MAQDGNDPVMEDAMISSSDTITVNPMIILPKPNECIDSKSLDQENNKYENCGEIRDLEIGGEPKSVSCAKKKDCQKSAETDTKDCDMGHGQQTHSFVDKKENAAISDHSPFNWPRPGQLELSDGNDEEAHVKAVYGTVQQVMNDLKRQNFVDSVNQMGTLKINSQAALQIAVDLTYKKAVDEPSFSAAIALMCKELAMMQVSGSKAGEKKSYVDFRKLIINLCQTEFEKNNVDQNARTIEMQEIEARADPEKKKELQHILTEDERRIRIKSVGNIRFIGQLFKQGMLTTNIMHRCIRHLLTRTDDKSLECLCKLLSTIGKDLESKNQNLDDYFEQMLAVVNGEVPLKVSSRVRFMLQDLVELRLNEWLPRRDDRNAKTIDQIQKKADNERLDTQKDNIPSKRRGKRNRNSDNQRNRDRNSRNGSQQLGSRSPSRYSSPHDTSRSQSMSMPPPQPIKSNPPATSASISNKPAAIMTKKPSIPKRSATIMTEKQLAKKVAYILEEYLSDTNINIAASKVRKTFDNSTFANFVRKTLNGVVEKSVTARKQVSQLMTYLISENILPMSLYLVGLEGVMDMAEDLVLDIPKIWVYLAELISYPLAEGVVPFTELKNTMAPLKNKGLAEKLMGELMIMLVQEKGPKWIKDEWDQAGLEWGDFLRDDESLNDFIKKYELEFIFGDGNSDFGSLSAQLKLNMEQIRERLLSLMSNEKENSFDNISSWISANVSERASEPQPIRVLMTATLEVSIEPHNNTFKFGTDKFHNRQTLISRYIKGFVTPQSAQESLAPKLGSQQGKPKSNKPAVIHVSSSLREDVQLRETENAWKPSRMKPSKAGEEDIKTEAFYKKVRGVLNKLTPQKFVTLVNQIRTLKIDSQERLQGVIDLVFEKAVDEPRFSVAYALMCKELAMMHVSCHDSKAGKESSNVNIRKLFITRCQMEFEKNTVDENTKAIKMQKIEACADPKMKEELQHKLTEDERRIRFKSVGNMRFMGELYKQEILTTNIMHRCIRHFLTQTDEESLECLCELLSTIGKELESKNQFQNLDQYFKQILDIINRKVSGKVSSRVRFMLQDVVELRLNKWVPRRDDTNPKTMNQIQKEAEKERLDTHMDNTPLNMPRKVDRNRDRKRNCKFPETSNGKVGGRPTEEGGWNQPVRSGTQYFVRPSKHKNNPPPMDYLELGNKTMYQCSRNVSTDAPKTIKPNKFSIPQKGSSKQDKRADLLPPSE